MEKTHLDKLSRELADAERDRVPIEPITDRFPEITIPEAYAIQLQNIKAKVQSGAVVVGKKIGLTSRAMQDMFGVREPDYGHILDNAVILESQTVSLSCLIQPRVEAEICFILNEDLKGPGVTTADVLKATAGVVPAFEIIDSRVKDWRIKIQDTIADNASNALVVLGGKLTAISDLDLRLVGMLLMKDGEIVATAAGAAVMGNPVQAVAWLANTLGQYDIALRSGEFIMSGSLTAAVSVHGGSSLYAIFDRLGSVSTRFVV
ncbi:MAG: 2-keto-4-pentenoate hydratase [Chloroflexi bacterium]|nr:2-keto-4-pentenoate hydratase [Chloroflexota bacterium]